MKSFLNKLGGANFILFLLLFLPNNSFGSLLQILLTLIIVLFFKPKESRFSNTTQNLIKFLLVVCVLVTIIYTYLGQFEIYSQSVIKILYLTFLIFFFPISKNSFITKEILFISCLFIFVTQIAYIFNISPIVDFINNYYTSDDYLNSSEVKAASTEVSDLFNLRFGGIYRNPNQAGRVLNLLFAILLVNRSFKKFSSIDFLSMGVLLVSILLTGSRTAFFVLILLSLFYFFFFQKEGKVGIIFITSIIIVPLFLFIGFESRVFDFADLAGSGSNSSFSVKQKFLFNYINERFIRRPTDLFFGTFNIDNINYNYGLNISKFDSEIGYIIHSIGFFGLITIFLFYFKIFVFSNLRVKMIMLLLFWSITSSVLTNFRFSVLFFFVVSLYYYPSKKNVE